MDQGSIRCFDGLREPVHDGYSRRRVPIRIELDEVLPAKGPDTDGACCVRRQDGVLLVI